MKTSLNSLMQKYAPKARIWWSTQSQQVRGLSVAVLFAGFGALTVVAANAEKIFIMIDVDTGERSGHAAIVKDESAAGGKYIMFSQNAPVSTTTADDSGSGTPSGVPSGGSSSSGGQVLSLSLSRVPWEGGPSYYKKWSSLDSGGWDDPNFFPIGVWFSSTRSWEGPGIDLDKGHGINTYVVLTDDSDFDLAQSKGMHVVAQSVDFAGSPHPSIDAWHIDDEADMMYGPGSDPWNGTPGWNTCIPIQDNGGRCGYTVMNYYKGLLPNDGKPRYANFGKGVLFWETDAEAETFVNNYTDFLSADYYGYTDLWCGVAPCDGAASYGWTVDRLRTLDAMDGKRQPIWNFVELGWPWNESAAQGGRLIQPNEMAGAVWNSLIHEARGILYFNHSFNGPCFSYNIIRQTDCTVYDGMRAKLKTVNGQIKTLAPVLNSQSYQYSFNSNLETMLKTHGSSAYIFAMIKDDTAPGSRIFTLPNELKGVSSVEVMFENRSISVSNGQFTDNFAAEYSYHIYKVTP